MPVEVQAKADSRATSIDMEPVVRLAVMSGIQSMAAMDRSKQRKRKREAAQLNGSVDDVDMMETANSQLGNCEGIVQRKKRKKSTHSQQADKRGSREVVATAASELTNGTDSKSSLEDEVEIWIPNKKYKGPRQYLHRELSEKSNGTHRSAKKNDTTPFMKFTPVHRTPAALARRRIKLSHSEPKQPHALVTFTSPCNNTNSLRFLGPLLQVERIKPVSVSARLTV